MIVHFVAKENRARATTRAYWLKKQSCGFQTYDVTSWCLIWNTPNLLWRCPPLREIVTPNLKNNPSTISEMQVNKILKTSWCCATSKNQAPCSYNWTNHPCIDATYSVLWKCFEFYFVMLLDSELSIILVRLIMYFIIRKLLGFPEIRC